MKIFFSIRCEPGLKCHNLLGYVDIVFLDESLNGYSLKFLCLIYIALLSGHDLSLSLGSISYVSPISNSILTTAMKSMPNSLYGDWGGARLSRGFSESNVNSFIQIFVKSVSPLRTIVCFFLFLCSGSE